MFRSQWTDAIPPQPVCPPAPWHRPHAFVLQAAALAAIGLGVLLGFGLGGAHDPLQFTVLRSTTQTTMPSVDALRGARVPPQVPPSGLSCHMVAALVRVLPSVRRCQMLWGSVSPSDIRCPARVTVPRYLCIEVWVHRPWSPGGAPAHPWFLLLFHTCHRAAAVDKKGCGAHFGRSICRQV